MMTASKAEILVIEGKRSDRPSFVSGLMKKGFHVNSVASGSAALEYLDETLPDVVIIDAASMRTSGRRICRSVHQRDARLPIVLIHDGTAELSADEIEANVVLGHPFTLQKLLNRIKPFLPVVEKNVLSLGPIQLDTEQRWVRCGSKQVMLTPRLLALLRALMDHPGELIEREKLFCQVWETEYTGDTRTLDVHISWLRNLLEDDPRKPRYIKTVRGMGYRLDLDDNPPNPNGRA